MTERQAGQETAAVVRASLSDTVRLGATVLAPLLATGVIVRRPAAMALAERWQVDGPAVRLLQDLRTRYGPGPLRLEVPGRTVVLPLSAEDVRRVLHEGPEPFTPANREKKAALSPFQPHGVLISEGDIRTKRRRFNEAVLDTDLPLHHLSTAVVTAAREEARSLLGTAEATGHLGWDDFARGWWRLVRRVVLGDGARDDEVVTDQLRQLRTAGNWAYLGSRRTGVREQFQQRLRGHLRRAEKNSLASLVADAMDIDDLDAAGQVPHWLFAYDAGGIAVFRTLALLSAHPEQERAARDELTGVDLSGPQVLPVLRAALSEALRLWPTTPAILRDSTVDTDWYGTSVPAGTAFVVFTPFFHRDDTTLPFAHDFVPDIWLDGRASELPALVPFSAGPAECPGRNLVLLTMSALLAALLEQHRFRLLSGPSLDPGAPLPFTIDNFGLDFAVETADQSRPMSSRVGRQVG
ncbi:MAG TPA: cytochrome P450 [Pseudonocardiaceae bacterium]|jgi:cytochrome P450